jgi:hypothetical protein
MSEKEARLYAFIVNHFKLGQWLQVAGRPGSFVVVALERDKLGHRNIVLTPNTDYTNLIKIAFDKIDSVSPNPLFPHILDVTLR